MAPCGDNEGSIYRRNGGRWCAVFCLSCGPDDKPERKACCTKRLRGDGRSSPHTFHGLRHACASLLLCQQVPVRVIMDTFGYAQPGMATRYTHLAPGSPGLRPVGT